MKILAIDTSAKTGSVAITSNEELLAEETYKAESSHAEFLMGVVDKALKKAGCDIAQIDGIAVSIGSGSFTGLRVGLAAAKGLALALNKPIVGVSLEGQEPKASIVARLALERLKSGQTDDLTLLTPNYIRKPPCLTDI